jgi:hypothetical protein
MRQLMTPRPRTVLLHTLSITAPALQDGAPPDPRLVRRQRRLGRFGVANVHFNRRCPGVQPIRPCRAKLSRAPETSRKDRPPASTPHERP